MKININDVTKPLFTQLLQTDLERSDAMTGVTEQMWLTGLMVPSYPIPSITVYRCNQKNAISTINEDDDQDPVFS